MADEPEFKSWVLPVEGHDLMRDFRNERIEGQAELREIEADFRAKVTEVQNRRKAAMMTLWRKMAVMVGLDPESWRDNQYGVEARYLHLGFAALTFLKSEPQMHPLQAILGGQEPTEEELEGPPPAVDPTKLH
jgi:hypothetical protein